MKAVVCGGSRQNLALLPFPHIVLKPNHTYISNIQHGRSWQNSSEGFAFPWDHAACVFCHSTCNLLHMPAAGKTLGAIVEGIPRTEIVMHCLHNNSFLGQKDHQSMRISVHSNKYRYILDEPDLLAETQL